MQGLKKKIYLLAGVACFGISTTAMATAITGNLSVANCSGGGVTVTATSIVWSPDTGSGTAGCIDTGIATNVSYTGGTLGSGVTGEILNLTSGGGAVDSFMTFSGTPLDFVLTGLGPGLANTNCNLSSINTTCSVAAGSPFILTYISANVTGVALGAFGTVNDGLGGEGNWIGSFTTQLNYSGAQIQSMELGGQSISSTNSGNFTVTAVPEPGSVSILILGSAVLLGFSRLRFRKS